MKKLVRNKIPEYIKDKSKISREFNPNAIRKYNAAKVLEEASEVSKALLRGSQEDLMEEIGDLYEVLDKLIRDEHVSKAEIQCKKNLKSIKKGTFSRNYVLEIE
jgi:predicted house-cleaning noncanonical NTP pyrophosphatase (MazG superfamily)